jgi:hypothetical protein
MSNQTSEAFAYVEREYKDVKGRVELQGRVVEQLHMIKAHVGEAEASLNALLDDEASKLRILDYLRKWLGDKLEEMPAIALGDFGLATATAESAWSTALGTPSCRGVAIGTLRHLCFRAPDESDER